MPDQNGMDLKWQTVKLNAPLLPTLPIKEIKHIKYKVVKIKDLPVHSEMIPSRKTVLYDPTDVA